MTNPPVSEGVDTAVAIQLHCAKCVSNNYVHEII